MLGKFTKINFEILVVIESPQDGIDMTLGNVLVKLDHEAVQLIKVDEAKVPQIQVRKACNRVKISLPLQLLFLFLNLHVIVQLLFNKP